MGVRGASAHAFFLRAPIPFSLSASAIWRIRLIEPLRILQLGLERHEGLADERGERVEGARGGVLGGAIARSGMLGGPRSGVLDGTRHVRRRLGREKNFDRREDEL